MSHKRPLLIDHVRRWSLVLPVLTILAIVASTSPTRTAYVKRNADVSLQERIARPTRQTAQSSLTSLNLSPIADAYVSNTATSSNFGLSPELRSKRSSLESYLKFDLTGVGTESVTSAKLRLTGGLNDTSGANVVVQVFGVSSISWTETTIVWSNKPSSSSTALAAVTIANNVPTQYELDVSSFVKSQQSSGRTVISLAIKNPTASTPFATFNSREAPAGTPQLLITTTPPPTAVITAPSSGTVLLAPASITIDADAYDLDGITQVEFVQGSTVLATDNTFPYSFTWNNVPVGAYTLTARATDAVGGTAVSAPVIVTVATTFPPTITIISPASGSLFASPATVTIFADAADADGISKVDFFEGNKLLGTATSAPYSFTWSGVPPCSYYIRAKATDALGATATSAPLFLTVTDNTIGDSTPPNFKIAFFGDQGLGPLSVPTLNLVLSEGAQALVLAGDLDYNDDPTAWEDQLNSTVGPNFPVFTLSGNHDEDAWHGSTGYQKLIQDRFDRLGIPWCGSCGVQSAFHYKGIFFVFTTPGLDPIVDLGNNDSYIRDQLAADHSIWSIASWHKNMGLMQAGGKSDETGWGVYEEARAGGAIIVNAHEHSYFRTHLLSSMINQTVASTANILNLTKGESFVTVSGLGGESRRDQEVTGPWIARIYAATCLPGDPICRPDAVEGALFGVFNADGQQNKANFYFKDVNGQILDSFTVISQVDMPNIQTITPAQTSAGAGDFVLSVNGSGFINESLVFINGSPHTTTFVSSTQLTSQVTAADVLVGGSVPVQVVNRVTGGGSSNQVNLSVSFPPNPVPSITSLSPASITSGGSDQTLTISGTDFVSNSIVRFDGIDRQTLFLSPTELTATLTASDIQLSRSIVITVFNPEPGGGNSNALELVVSEPGYEGDVAPRPKGSNNGTVSIADWVQLGRFVAGLDVLDCNSEFVRADVAPKASKGNGSLTVSDWAQAGRYAAGLDPAVPAGGPTCILSERNGISKNTWLEPLNHHWAIGSSRTVRISLANNAMLENTGEVNITLDASGNENALGFTLYFRPADLRFVSAKKVQDAGNATFALNADHAAKGFLGIALALPPGQTFERGTRQLLTLTFRVLQHGEMPFLAFADCLVQQEIADVNARALEANFLPRLASDGDWFSVLNRIDDARFFVSQHYEDILGRRADPEGLDYWTNEITSCGNDLACVANRRIAVSTSFFLSQEFQETGFLIYQLYKASLGRKPQYDEFVAERHKLAGIKETEIKKKLFITDWTNREVFYRLYPVSLSPSEFVNRLYNTANIYAPADRAGQIRALRNGLKTRADILREVMENGEFITREYNSAFVRMQYFGYLQREPDVTGESFWLALLNQSQPDPNYYRSLICGFVTSVEYQLRFGTISTRSNSSCSQQ